ncbi:unnamed protein product [Zymoseptoria tritici ST99CH_1A5]|uniref:Major facilitator superfamily (MFS) profile domain-containing protein n=1 Tax=Zymoseptoria tritici ST99CH_1A5 TaxID=1276529 RepID=A0A1Y6LFQ2_ZYMTR|nr:unnamed protein product [Zymoseptoria tritici ST99CH_1A5]
MAEDHVSVHASEKSNTSLKGDNSSKDDNSVRIDDEEETLELIDGGTRAWLQVAGSFLVFGNLFGFVFAFGTFQSYYELTYLPSTSASNIAWIGTVALFLLLFVGSLSGPLFDRGYFRTMLLLGAAIETLGVFLVSISTTYWQLMLTQGVLMGLGNGLLFLPGIALVSRSFRKHRAVAMGIATCGSPVGGVVYILVFERLILRTTFGETVRAMGFLMLGTYALSIPLLLFRATNLGDLVAGGASRPRQLFDRAALSDAPFWIYTISNFLIFCGYTNPIVFIPSYAQQVLGTSRSTSFNIAIIAQATSIIGRIVAGLAAARIGGIIPLIFCVVSSASVNLGWIGATSVGSFIAYSALYGTCSGAIVPLPPSVFPAVCPDRKLLGTRLGMSQGIQAFASLIGSPIAGALAEVGGQRYLGLQLFTGLVMFAGGAGLFALWGMLRTWNLFKQYKIEIVDTLHALQERSHAGSVQISVIVGSLPAEVLRDADVPDWIFPNVEKGVLVEMAYGRTTAITEKALAAANWTVFDGIDVLQQQAFGQLEAWTGRPAPRMERMAALKSALGRTLNPAFASRSRMEGYRHPRHPASCVTSL